MGEHLRIPHANDSNISCGCLRASIITSEMPDENSTENVTVSAENPSTDPLLDIIVLEGHSDITISLNIHVM
jgi:hypothetical protein